MSRLQPNVTSVLLNSPSQLNSRSLHFLLQHHLALTSPEPHRTPSSLHASSNALSVFSHFSLLTGLFVSGFCRSQLRFSFCLHLSCCRRLCKLSSATAELPLEQALAQRLPLKAAHTEHCLRQTRKCALPRVSPEALASLTRSWGSRQSPEAHCVQSPWSLSLYPPDKSPEPRRMPQTQIFSALLLQAISWSMLQEIIPAMAGFIGIFLSWRKSAAAGSCLFQFGGIFQNRKIWQKLLVSQKHLWTSNIR